MKKVVLSISTAACWALLLAAPQVQACSVFLLHDQATTLVAHSFDWHIDDGLIVLNKRGMAKRDFSLQADEQPVHWTSRFASLTVNWVGQEMPVIGVNEAGLLVAGLLLNATDYPEPDTRPVCNSSLVKQYVLDTAMSVRQALDILQGVRIYTRSRFGQHFLFADAGGDCAVVQFIDGKAQIYHGDTLPVPAITNNCYLQGITHLVRQTLPQRQIGGSWGGNSVNRFIEAAKSVRAFGGRASNNDIDWAYAALDRNKQGNTRWQSVFDLRKRVLFIRTEQQAAIRRIPLAANALSCSTPALYMDVNYSDTVLHAVSREVRAQYLEAANQVLHLDRQSCDRLLDFQESMVCRQPEK